MILERVDKIDKLLLNTCYYLNNNTHRADWDKIDAISYRSMENSIKYSTSGVVINLSKPELTRKQSPCKGRKLCCDSQTNSYRRYYIEYRNRYKNITRRSSQSNTHGNIQNIKKNQNPKTKSIGE